MLASLRTVADSRCVAVSAADPALPDCPLIYVNRAFTELTGYAADEVLGHNCRFLQAGETDRDSVARMREALSKRRPVTLCLLNRRKDGSQFHNFLVMEPMVLHDGSVWYMGCQYDMSHSTVLDDLEGHLGELDGLVSDLESPSHRVAQMWVETLTHRSSAIVDLVRSYLAVNGVMAVPRGGG